MWQTVKMKANGCCIRMSLNCAVGNVELIILPTHACTIGIVFALAREEYKYIYNDTHVTTILFQKLRGLAQKLQINLKSPLPPNLQCRATGWVFLSQSKPTVTRLGECFSANQNWRLLDDKSRNRVFQFCNCGSTCAARPSSNAILYRC